MSKLFVSGMWVKRTAGKGKRQLPARLVHTLMLAILTFAFPLNAGQFSATPGLVSLQLSFVDPPWDGKIIPKGQQCMEYGGDGASPRIQVSNIPLQTDRLVLEFSDATYKPCDNGGHGIISYAIQAGSQDVTVPSIPGQTFELPDGFTLIQEHCGADLGMQAGAYIGPCPGFGNKYYVIVRAYHDSSGQSAGKLLGIGRLDIGTYAP